MARLSFLFSSGQAAYRALAGALRHRDLGIAPGKPTAPADNPTPFGDACLHRIAKGYNHPVGQVVKEVNGIGVKNLKHLVQILRDCADEYLIFRFAEQGAEVLVFQREEMNKATEEILDDNGISPSRRGSEDVLKVWKQKKNR